LTARNSIKIPKAVAENLKTDQVSWVYNLNPAQHLFFFSQELTG